MTKKIANVAAAFDFSKFAGAEDTEQFKSIAKVNNAAKREARSLKDILLHNLTWRYTTNERKHNWSTSKGGLTAFHVKSGATALTLPNGKTTMVVENAEFETVLKAIAEFATEGGFDEQLSALAEKHEAKLAKATATRAARREAEDESEEEQAQEEAQIEDADKK